MPPMASCLLFELYKMANQSPYVKILYKNTPKSTETALEIPKCGTKCPLNYFYTIYDDILPKESYDVACKLRDGESLPPAGNPENYAHFHVRKN